MTFIFLITTKCLWDLVMGVMMSLVPGILAWLGSRSFYKSDELKNEVAAQQEEIGILSLKTRELEGDLHSVRNELSDSRLEVDAKSAKISSLNAEIDGHSKSIETLKANVASLTNERDSWVSKFNIHENEANERFANLTADRDAWTKKYASLETETNGKTTALNAEIESWKTKFSTFEKAANDKAATLSGEVAEWQKRQAAWQTEKSNFENEVSGWKTQFGDWQGEKAEYSSQINNWNVRYSNLENEKNEISEKQSRLQMELTTKNTELQQWSEKFHLWEKDKTALLHTIETREEELKTWKSRFGQLEHEKSALRQTIEQRDAEIHDWNTRFKDWEREKTMYIANVDEWRARFETMKDEHDSLLIRLNDLEEKMSKSRTFNCMGRLYRWNDLEIVEGIGPKIEELLRGAGVFTWQNLADTPVERLREILERAGGSFKLADPTFWPEQAKLALNEDCENLRILQESLTGGRAGVAIERVSYKEQAKTMEKTLKAAGLDEDSMRKARARETEELSLKFFGRKVRRDDHQIVEGIGPKIDELLRNAGIQTWKKLSETQPSAIKKILDAAGPKFQMHSPETWPEQARLADENEFQKLREYQESLTAGRA